MPVNGYLTRLHIKSSAIIPKSTRNGHLNFKISKWQWIANIRIIATPSKLICQHVISRVNHAIRQQSSHFWQHATDIGQLLSDHHMPQVLMRKHYRLLMHPTIHSSTYRSITRRQGFPPLSTPPRRRILHQQLVFHVIKNKSSLSTPRIRQNMQPQDCTRNHIQTNEAMNISA